MKHIIGKHILLLMTIICLNSTATLHAGKIRVTNQTDTAGTVSFKTLLPSSDGITYTQGENEISFSVAPGALGEWDVPGAALNKFKFSKGPIGGLFGERFKPTTDGTYPEIVVPTKGTWDIFFVKA